jgi:large subunit ribosomal protein L24
MKIKKNDTVIVLTGKNKGAQGKVLVALPRVSKVVVEGVNITKKHTRSRKRGEKGQIIDRPLPLDVSNVALIDPKENKPTRVGYRIENGKKIRYSKRSGQAIP